MTKDQLKRQKIYTLAMIQLNAMKESSIITEEEFIIGEKEIREVYNPVILYIDLI